jgi:DNA adenine methylase
MSQKIKIRPPFKCHGGKFYLNQWIIEQFPKEYESMSYIEPFCGGANVLLHKTPSKEELINDLDSSIAIIMRILRDQVEDFVKNIKKVKYKEETFKAALDKTEFDDEMDKAINEFILRRMSRGGMKKAFAWSKRLRGNQPGDLNAWKTIISQLPKISERLQNVFIINRSAMEVLKIFDNVNVLAYIDPPYLPETRESPQVYDFEMNIEGHMELAEVLNNFKGKVLISAYPSRLYNRLYKGWTCESKKIVNHSSQQKIKPTKVELLWRNF